jgi:hypothetical protein
MGGRRRFRAKCLIPEDYMGRNKSAPGETRTPDPLLRRQLLYPPAWRSNVAAGTISERVDLSR